MILKDEMSLKILDIYERWMKSRVCSCVAGVISVHERQMLIIKVLQYKKQLDLLRLRSQTIVLTDEEREFLNWKLYDYEKDNREYLLNLKLINKGKIQYTWYGKWKAYIKLFLFRLKQGKIK